ncbi:MAG: hypothetical protein QM270_03375 [Bacillota bacterium]|nr:hypothetical protein [Bacillota bacterium]
MKRKKGIAGVVVLVLLASLILQANPVMAAEGDVAINATNFPDANFRNFVKQYDTNGDNILQQSERDTVKRMDAGKKEIASLVGIEYFSKLTSLLCYDNQLQTLDVSNNTELGSLICGNNQLEELDVSRNLELCSLYCHDNQLWSLDVSRNTELTALACSNNHITSLDVRQNTKLELLSCTRNHLSFLDLSRNNNLLTDYVFIYGQTLHFPIYSMWAGGKYQAHIAANSDDNPANISGVRLSDGSPLPASASYDADSGILTIDPDEKIDEITFDYDVHSPPFPDLRMDVTAEVSCGFDVNIAHIDGNGTVQADKTSGIDPGETVTLTITPAAGYELDYLWVADCFSGEVTVTNNQFVMPESYVNVAVGFREKGSGPHIAVFRAGTKTEYTAGETVALAARAEGGTPPYKYEFYVIRSNGARVILRNYAIANTYNWKPVTPDTYTVGVNAKDANGKIANMERTVKVNSATADPLRIAVFRAGTKTEYSPGETVALAARAEGGMPSYQYQFYIIRSNGTRVILRDYAIGNTYNWKPVTPDTYKVGVSARDANGKTVKQEKTVTVTSPLVVAVFRAGTKTVYTAGETVALAARGEGGLPPYQYQFYVIRSNGTRVILRNYATGNTYNWKPVTPDTYKVGVSIRDTAGTVRNQEKTVTVTSPLVVAVFRAGTKTEYTAGETVALAARGEGGLPSYQYQFYVYRSNGTRVILRDYALSNVYNWKPVTPDTYKVCVAIKDSNGKVVTAAVFVTVN